VGYFYVMRKLEVGEIFTHHHMIELSKYSHLLVSSPDPPDYDVFGKKAVKQKIRAKPEDSTLKKVHIATIRGVRANRTA
jgi:hypothetical protein